MKQEYGLQFTRYLLAGGLNTGVAYAIFALCFVGLRGHVPHGFILVLSHVLCVSFSFWTQGWFVFRVGRPRTCQELLVAWGRSQLAYLGLLIVGLLVNAVTIGWLGWSPWLAQALAMVIAVIAGWFLNKRLIFPNRSHERAPPG